MLNSFETKFAFVVLFVLNYDVVLCVSQISLQERIVREENKRWCMVVDTTTLLNKESRKALQLLQGLKRTYLIIPRIGNHLFVIFFTTSTFMYLKTSIHQTTLLIFFISFT